MGVWASSIIFFFGKSTILGYFDTKMGMAI